MSEGRGQMSEDRNQMTRLRSSSLGLRPSGYDPTRRRGTQRTETFEIVICYWLFVNSTGYRINELIYILLQ